MSFQEFTSRHHPGRTPPALLFTQALIQPLAACLLPVMVVTLVLVLQGAPILLLVAAAYPAATLLAAAWTAFRLRRLPARLRVHGTEASLQTVWEVARGLPAAWGPVVDLRDYGSWLMVAIGTDQAELERADWPEYPTLLAALDVARYGPA